MTQRRAARYVCWRHHNTSSVSDMLAELKWPTLEERRQQTRLTMMYKISHGMVKTQPGHKVVPLARRSRTARHSRVYRHIQTSTNYYKGSFYPRTIPHWNHLDPAIAEADTLEQFKTGLLGACPQ